MISLRKVARFQLCYHNLLERDLDVVYKIEFQPFLSIRFIHKLNIMYIFDIANKILDSKYHLYHKNLVTLQLAKYLFPRDLDES